MKKRMLFPTPVCAQIARSISVSQVPHFRGIEVCDDVRYVDGTKVVEEVQYVVYDELEGLLIVSLNATEVLKAVSVEGEKPEWRNSTGRADLSINGFQVVSLCISPLA
jgi:hypothetical protein